MRGTMQSALQRPDLSVWERTYLPTTSSKIKALLNGKYGVTSFASRPSEVGGMVFLETNWSDLHPRQTESSSSPQEESWSSWQSTQTSSSETLCPYSTSVLMDQPERLAHIHEEYLRRMAADSIDFRHFPRENGVWEFTPDYILECINNPQNYKITPRLKRLERKHS